MISDASAAMKMHDGEADIDAELVRRLVAAQFPRLAGLPVTPFRSTGTVNAIFRLGDRLYARLPRVARWARDLETESHRPGTAGLRSGSTPTCYAPTCWSTAGSCARSSTGARPAPEIPPRT